MSSKIIDNSQINDIRLSPQFRGVTFSKYKKTDVKIQLVNALKKGKIEPACYWGAEFVCAGHYMELWELIIHYMAKYIHLGNPKIAIYIENRISIFKNIIIQGHFTNELQLRNNSNVRKIFAEVITTICVSNKKPAFEQIKINKVEEFDITQMSEKLKAPSINYAEQLFQKKDPAELLIPMNEFAYSISTERKNMLTACYWIEWIIEFEVICRKKKENCYCEKRDYDVDSKFKRDPIWLIWDIILHYCDLQNNNFNKRIINSLLTLFCVKYNNSTCKKRRYLLYFAVSVITEVVPTNIELVSDKIIVETVFEKINNIYKQIKKSEETPNMDYLFSGLDKNNNFEKSLQQMELMNSIMNGDSTGGDEDFLDL
jgi:hypothetical protein